MPVYCTKCPFAMALHPTPPEAGNCLGYPPIEVDRPRPFDRCSRCGRERYEHAGSGHPSSEGAIDCQGVYG